MDVNCTLVYTVTRRQLTEATVFYEHVTRTSVVREYCCQSNGCYESHTAAIECWSASVFSVAQVWRVCTAHSGFWHSVLNVTLNSITKTKLHKGHLAAYQALCSGICFVVVYFYCYFPNHLVIVLSTIITFTFLLFWTLSNFFGNYLMCVHEDAQFDAQFFYILLLCEY